jgi:1-acyl-sn-glycerol-3-phosphate acyltransferase
VEAEWRAPLDPAKKYLFFSNHLSNLDPPALIPLLPGRTSIFVKRSLLRIPILGYGMKLAGFIPVDREGKVDAAKQSVNQAAAERARSGVLITSVVEGTRSGDGRLLPFKKGPFYLAMETCAPVVPVTIRGTEKLMPRGSLKVRPGMVRIVFHPPLDPGDFATREGLMEAVRASIALD